MAEKYLDYSGVQTLWNAVKDRDDQIAAGKAGYIAYDADNKRIQLWASETAYVNSKSDSTIVPISTVDATPFIKDGMLDDVSIVPASEVGPISYNGKSYDDETLFIQFKWNTESGKTSDYILLSDIAPVYTEGEGISIENNKISFEGGKSNQITTTGTIKLGGTKLGDFLKGEISEIPAGTNLQEFFKNLLSVESWPSEPKRIIPSSLSVSNPGPTVGFYTTSDSSKLAEANVEVGTTVYLMIKGKNASASASISYSGFDYGYSTVPDTDSSFTKQTGQPSSVSITGDEVANGVYSISVTENNTGLTIPSFTSNAVATQVKLNSAISYIVNDGTVNVKASQTCPNFTGSCSSGDLKKYYALSTLEATSDDHVVAAGSDVTLNGTGTTTSGSDSITGFRKLFYGSFDSNDTTQLTAENIRKTAGGSSTSGAAAASTYNITAKGKQLFWIAFPASKSWKVTKAITDGVDLTDNAKDWKTTTVAVPGANNYSPTNYTVYYFAAAGAYEAEKFNVTIG